MTYNRHQLGLFLRKGCEAVQGPCSYEGLGMLYIPTENVYCSTTRLRRPLEERQRPHNLEANLPFVAVRQLTNEHVLVGGHPIGMLAGELFQHVEGALGDQPIIIG